MHGQVQNVLLIKVRVCQWLHPHEWRHVRVVLICNLFTCGLHTRMCSIKSINKNRSFFDETYIHDRESSCLLRMCVCVCVLESKEKYKVHNTAFIEFSKKRACMNEFVIPNSGVPLTHGTTGKVDESTFILMRLTPIRSPLNPVRGNEVPGPFEQHQKNKKRKQLMGAFPITPNDRHAQ